MKRGPEPRVPIQIVAGAGVGVDRVGPEIVEMVARVIYLREDDVAEGALPDVGAGGFIIEWSDMPWTPTCSLMLALFMRATIF